MPNKDKITGAEPPEELTGIRTTVPKDVAAGLTAVVSSMKHISSELGLARGLAILSDLNQKGGIDCPGCAWPDPDDERSRLGEYCENGAKAIAEEATKKKLTADFFAENKVSELARLSDYELGKKGRIAQPVYLPAGADNYEAISWTAAFQKIADQLNTLDSPNEAIFYTSGRTSNEAAFLYQLFVRRFGTNNLPDCSNMCHESSGLALSETVGIGKGSVKLEDFYEAEVIMVIGQNPGTNHPRMLTALERAKKNGATIITVNPIKETGLVGFSNPQNISGLLGKTTSLTDHYLQIRLNADMALMQALTKILLEKERQLSGSVFDLDFIETKTAGYEAYCAHLDKLDLDELIAATGLDSDRIQLIAQILAEQSKIIVCWAMGLTQHKNSVNTIKEVVNLLLLKGSIGRPGAGTCPVRGHSNVQGDRTMGIHEKPSAKLLDKIQEVYGFEPSREHGHDTVSAIAAMYEGAAKVFIGLGGNFLSATPDTNYTAKALQNCKLTVQVSTKLNRSHLIHGQEALILPCLARTDKDTQQTGVQFVSVENSMGVVHSSQGKLTPISTELRSEPAIICGIAQTTLGSDMIPWADYVADYSIIRDAIEQTIAGFDNYNTRVREPAGFYLPNGAREQQFHTTSGKAEFTVSEYVPVKLKENEFLMMTIRSHDQFNTTIYGLDDRYRGIYNERRVIMISKEDMNNLKVSKGDLVDLHNNHLGVARIAKKFVVVPYDIPTNCVATYFPEANVLVPIGSKADRSNTPASKSVIITIKPHQPT